jgi:hypothetical protein
MGFDSSALRQVMGQKYNSEKNLHCLLYVPPIFSV